MAVLSRFTHYGVILYTVQDRCDKFTLISNPFYGPPAFRFYDVIKSLNVTDIYIIRDPNKAAPTDTEAGHFIRAV